MHRRLRRTRKWTVKLTAGPMSRTVTVEAPTAAQAIHTAADYLVDTPWTPASAWPR